jgi:hypothetical protein
LAVEAEAVDHRLVLVEAEQPFAAVARLRPRRHRAGFGKAEAERQHGVGHFRILVEAGRQPDGIGKVDIEDARGENWIVRRLRAAHEAKLQGADGQAMRGFRLDQAQERTRERVEGHIGLSCYGCSTRANKRGAPAG